jgi:hypothetical protein
MVRIPDFVADPQQKFRLEELGFTVHVDTGTADGPPPIGNVAIGDAITVSRGGGAVSVIRDEPITTNLEAKANQPFTVNGVTRPWFSAVPICEHNTEPASAKCLSDVVDRYFDYRTASGTTAFSHPRGVAVFPYVAFEFPRFGDRVQSHTPITVRWRDTRIQSMAVVLSDLDTLTTSGDPTPLNVRNYPDPQNGTIDFTLQTATAEFAALFPPLNGPQDGHHYRIEIQVFKGSGGSEELSRTAIDVSFELTTGNTQSKSLTLAPTIAAVSMNPGSTRRLGRGSHPKARRQARRRT